jgi:hypothetical protein
VVAFCRGEIVLVREAFGDVPRFGTVLRSPAIKGYGFASLTVFEQVAPNVFAVTFPDNTPGRGTRVQILEFPSF